VTAEVFSMVLLGALAGLAVGMASARYIESLLYQVKPTDPAMLTLPALTILVAALVAAGNKRVAWKKAFRISEP
jgi:hypothetical protein